MSHDEIRDYLERIDAKIDSLSAEVTGDGGEKLGHRIRLDRLEQREEFRGKVMWAMAAGVLATLGERLWSFLSGR